MTVTPNLQPVLHPDGIGDLETSMAIDAVREQSLEVLTKHGLSIPDSLPLLDGETLRPLNEILDRLFCLNAVAAAAYGFDAAKALSWIHDENLEVKLALSERAFLERGEGDRDALKLQVEGMCALAWAASIVHEMDFWRDCDPKFVALLPNLKENEKTTRLVQQADDRPNEQVIAACDLSYCLHWIIRESLIKNEKIPAGLKPYVVIERRRSLEWMLGDEAWDMVSLDT